MHDSLQTPESDRAWPPPSPPRTRRRHALALAAALILVAAAVLASVELYGEPRRTTTPAASPIPPCSGLGGQDPWPTGW
jgi:hypothetical protein